MTLEWVEGKLGQMERRREGRGRSARRMEKGRKMKRGKCEKTSSQRQAAVEADLASRGDAVRSTSQIGDALAAGAA